LAWELHCSASGFQTNFAGVVSAVNDEKNKFEEVLEKAKIKRDELAERTADRKAKEHKKEAEEAAVRDLNRTPGSASQATQHWN
jgi:DNA-binding protein H-NS